MDEDALVAATFPNRKDDQSVAYGRGWEAGVDAAWDPSRGRFDDAALAEAQERVSEIAAILESMEAEGRKYYSDSTELTKDFADHRDDYDFWRGLVDGHLDDRHYKHTQHGHGG